MNLRSRLCFLPAAGAFHLSALIAFLPIALGAQTAQSDANPASSAIHAIFVSDIHFDPFADPSKVKQLAGAPIENWDAILAASAGDTKQSYRNLLETCGTRGPDTPYALLKASLKEMTKRASGVKFVTVTGDLVVHSFECKLDKTLPTADASARADFAAKTIGFVARQVRTALPGVPVYFALGNNDSDCGDYRLDPHSSFLAAIAPALTLDAPASQRRQAVDDFSAAGYYAVDLPAPIRDARLLVIDDTFMAAHFSSCSGKDDRSGENLTLSWLSEQLNAARGAHQRIWVIGHIPPSIDLKGSISHATIGACGHAPKTYLDSGKLADELTASSETIKVALFGHTHMDEMHLLTPGSSVQQRSSGNVAVKVVPSISPINGNNPSFLVAEIDPETAEIADYKLIVASGSDPAGIHWSESYDYRSTYREKAFNNAAVSRIAAGFHADIDASTPASSAYIRNFMPGTGGELLRFVWLAYACTISSQDVTAFTNCSCPK